MGTETFLPRFQWDSKNVVSISHIDVGWVACGGSRSCSATRFDSIIHFQSVVRETQCEIENNCELDLSQMKSDSNLELIFRLFLVAHVSLAVTLLLC